MFHGVADVFTLGLWEVVGTPVEMIANGDQVTVKVFYDENSYVTNVEIHGEKKSPPEEPKQPDGNRRKVLGCPPMPECATMPPVCKPFAAPALHIPTRL